MRTAALIVLLVTACGGKSASTAASGAPSCTRDPMGCYRARLGACTDTTRVWRLDVDQVGTIYVSDSGLLRLDQPDRRLHGVDSQRWLGCLADCAACVPYFFDLGLTHEMQRCHLGEADAEAWNGLPSKLLVGLCDGRTRIRVRYIPELAAVRDALIATEVIARDDALAAQPGLVVETILGTLKMVDIRTVERATCADLALPADRPHVADRRAFAELEGLAPRLRAEHSVAAQEEAEKSGPVLEDVLLRKLGEACLGQRDRYEAQDVVKCLDERPEIDKDAIAYEAGLLWVQQTSAAVAPVMRRTYDAPLCKAFTGSRE